MSLNIDNERILEKYKAFQTKIDDLKKIELSALPVYDKRYVKFKIKTYRDKVYTNFRGLNMLEADIEYEFFTAISIEFLLAYEIKYYPQVYLDNRAYKITNKQMTDYLYNNLLNKKILQTLH